MEPEQKFEDEHPVIASCATAAGDVAKWVARNKTTVAVGALALAIASRGKRNSRSRD